MTGLSLFRFGLACVLGVEVTHYLGRWERGGGGASNKPAYQNPRMNRDREKDTDRERDRDKNKEIVGLGMVFF